MAWPVRGKYRKPLIFRKDDTFFEKNHDKMLTSDKSRWETICFLLLVTGVLPHFCGLMYLGRGIILLVGGDRGGGKTTRAKGGIAMEIIMRKVSELTPYDKNAKKHDERQIANVAESIKEMGWLQPLVIDADGVVVVGHCRLAAAKRIGEKEVPCVVADDLTEEQIKKYRVLDNKLNESPWDLGLLAEDIEGLDFSGYDLDMELYAADVDIDDFFTDAEQKEKEPKKIQCPHCGEWFEK